ncbi:MAG: FKBP-type peptidyl-prolyl cis-trans isomerase [Thiotrichales bacterium]|nr:FKBP-type peptidyl-prolyl cis-trans isomerase [Thiotrichales bacterium]
MQLRLPFALLCALGFTAQTAVAQSPAPHPQLSTIEQQASYTLGVDLAKNLRQEGLEIDAKALSMGLQDALNGAPLALSEAQMSQAIQEAQKMMQAKQEAARKVEAEKNAQAGNAYRLKYAEQSGVLTTKSGILYKVLTQGEGQSPSTEDSIFTHYEGRFIDDKVFDSSYQRGRALKIRATDVIKGWGEILQMMKPGDKWEVVIPPELAYGEKGAGEMIGPNQTLIFTIELISFGKEDS